MDDARVTGVGDGVTVGEAVADADGAENAGVLGPAALVAAAPCPDRMTASAIADPVTATAPAPKAAPDRKLVSSMRSLTVLLSLLNLTHPSLNDTGHALVWLQARADADADVDVDGGVRGRRSLATVRGQASSGRSDGWFRRPARRSGRGDHPSADLTR